MQRQKSCHRLPCELASCYRQTMRLVRVACGKAAEIAEGLRAALKGHETARVARRVRRHAGAGAAAGAIVGVAAGAVAVLPAPGDPGARPCSDSGLHLARKSALLYTHSDKPCFCAFYNNHKFCCLSHSRGFAAGRAAASMDAPAGGSEACNGSMPAFEAGSMGSGMEEDEAQEGSSGDEEAEDEERALQGTAGPALRGGGAVGSGHASSSAAAAVVAGGAAHVRGGHAGTSAAAGWRPQS